MEKPKTIRKPKKPIPGDRKCIKSLSDYLYLSNYDVSSITFGELRKELEKFCIGNDIKDPDRVELTIAIDITTDSYYSSNDSEAYLYYIKEEDTSEYEEKMKRYEEDLKDYKKKYTEYKKKKKVYDEWKKEQDRLKEIETIKQRLKELET